jgi:ABC-type multidrug transport system fused ATPase/permease subunit
MKVEPKQKAISATMFLGQLFALGFFSRIVQILAILCLLNLNDYFTTSSQISSLIPAASLIISLLLLVALADTVGSRIIQSLIKRLARIHSLFGFLPDQFEASSTSAQQRQYLRTVFLPLVMAVSPAPLLIIVLVSTTPFLFVISILQAVVNSIIIYHYNSRAGSHFKSASSPARPNSDPSITKDQVHLLRRTGWGSVVKFHSHDVNNDNSEVDDQYLRIKREVLRTSNLVFRGLILTTSAILAIYKLSSLTSVVGFFILNNTLRYTFVVLAEYCWPSVRHLSFKQACKRIKLALQPEESLLQRLQHIQDLEVRSFRAFDERMEARLAQRPFLRLKGFRLIINKSHASIVLDELTARLGLNQITLVHVAGSNLCRDLVNLIADREHNSLKAEIRGVAVCAQLPMDLNFWRQLPIADVQKNRVITVSIIDHFAEEYRSRVASLIDEHQLKSFYLEGDPEPSSTQDFSRRQIRRMSALITLLDLTLQRHCLWLVPFVLDPFEESEIMKLLAIYTREAPHDQRAIFLLSRSLPATDTDRCYELRRTTLKSCS